MYGRKPYYIMTHQIISQSKYVIVGTRTPTQEATFLRIYPLLGSSKFLDIAIRPHRNMRVY